MALSTSSNRGDLLLYALTLDAQKRVEASGLGKHSPDSDAPQLSEIACNQVVTRARFERATPSFGGWPKPKK